MFLQSWFSDAYISYAGQWYWDYCCVSVKLRLVFIRIDFELWSKPEGLKHILVCRVLFIRHICHDEFLICAFEQVVILLYILVITCIADINVLKIFRSREF